MPEMWNTTLKSAFLKITGSRMSFLKKVRGKLKKSAVTVLVILGLAVVLSSAPHASAKPSFFALPSFSSSGIWDSILKLGGGGANAESNAAVQGRRSALSVKPYSGLRLTNDSLVMIYFYDQTVAIVELGPNKLLLNCELIEVNEEEDRRNLLSQLSKQLNVPYQISFNKMMKLMSQCHQIEGAEKLVSERVSRMLKAVESKREEKKKRNSHTGQGAQPRGLLDNSPLSLLSGIIPGTKWCGTGDIAANYFDLGADKAMDRCCRTHDLCPVKVKAFSHKYNLTNNSIYSKSHCRCDDALFTCLKKTNTSASQIMGDIYFNLVKVQCVEERQTGRGFRDARQGF